MPEKAPRALDLVFLPGLLAQAAGAPIDDWLAANILARVECAAVWHADTGSALRAFAACRICDHHL